ncbi:MAG TPA: triose-phosphate isomerase [Pyrinomonadaceae bacterium]|nr:triose-phosphate isomerase [Acidobacteriota bacterium]HQZ95178.1 triose-phosphate isomerase [Pyrinomonadaceae bacterium]
MRKPVIAGNWKMYKLLGESVETALALKPLVANANNCEVVIAPVFTALKTVADRLEGSNINIAAQNCASQNEFGAHTGEIAPAMLKDVGCSHVIIGHSERRQFYGETDASVNKKTKATLAAGLTAIVCVGEMLAEREAGNAENIVKGQLLSGLDGLTVADMERIIIAYEPVWAIGTGKTATPEQAQDMHATVRKTVADSHGSDVAGKVRILYGGSVKPDNIAILMSQPDVDGALVGGASLEAESFAQIVNFERK